MKLVDTLLLSFAIVFFIIGVHQTLYANAIGASYWLFMLSTGCWLWFVMRKKNREAQQEENKPQPKTPMKTKAKSKAKK